MLELNERTIQISRVFEAKSLDKDFGTMKIASNDNVRLGCCKISARLGTLIIGCVAAIAHLIWMLIAILQQKTQIFKATSEQPTGYYTEQIFGTLIAFAVVGALLGILLIISVIGRKGVLKTLAYPWIPITAILLLTFYILELLGRGRKIHYWNDYYESGQMTTTLIIMTIIQSIAAAVGFSIFSRIVWTFIKTDYKNSTDPDQA